MIYFRLQCHMLRFLPYTSYTWELLYITSSQVQKVSATETNDSCQTTQYSVLCQLTFKINQSNRIGKQEKTINNRILFSFRCNVMVINYLDSPLETSEVVDRLVLFTKTYDLRYKILLFIYFVFSYHIFYLNLF